MSPTCLDNIVAEGTIFIGWYIDGVPLEKAMKAGQIAAYS